MHVLDGRIDGLHESKTACLVECLAQAAKLVFCRFPALRGMLEVAVGLHVVGNLHVRSGGLDDGTDFLWIGFQWRRLAFPYPLCLLLHELEHFFGASEAKYGTHSASLFLAICTSGDSRYSTPCNALP